MKQTGSEASNPMCQPFWVSECVLRKCVLDRVPGAFLNCQIRCLFPVFILFCVVFWHWWPVPVCEVSSPVISLLTSCPPSPSFSCSTEDSTQCLANARQVHYQWTTAPALFKLWKRVLLNCLGWCQSWDPLASASGVSGIRLILHFCGMC